MFQIGQEVEIQLDRYSSLYGVIVAIHEEHEEITVQDETGQEWRGPMDYAEEL